MPALEVPGPKEAPTKQCYRCKSVLTVGAFFKRTQSADGLQSNCKDCQRATRKSYGGTTYKIEKAPDPRVIVLSADQKRSAYSAAILRMVHAGMMSTEMATESLERVRAIED